MEEAFIPVIVCGGSGSRLWPVSRQAFPKPFHAWMGEYSLFQQTLKRAETLSSRPPIIITHADYQFIVKDQAKCIGIPLAGVILEPEAKNTAPAVAIASHAVRSMDPKAHLLIMPADHTIVDVAPLLDGLGDVSHALSQGYLVTFGIRPQSAHTGYGYIRQGEAINSRVHLVQQFCEKPSLDRAERFVANGQYYWNSGMFAMRPQDYLAELAMLQPSMATHCEAAWLGRVHQDGVTQLARDPWDACEADSIDYAVMEKTEHAAIMPCALLWSDIGSWSSLAQHWDKDASGNATHGRVVAQSSQNNILMSQQRMLATVGLQDHIVVETSDAVLVAHKDHDQDIKSLVSHLLDTHCDEAITHPMVHRPWGTFETVLEWPGYKVKRIVVNPGARLSLQRHRHRSEHWVVVKGEAHVRVADQEKILLAGESIDIPVQALHRLINESPAPLEIVEIQLGSYLGEDDIERFDDVYGRSHVSKEAVDG